MGGRELFVVAAIAGLLAVPAVGAHGGGDPLHHLPVDDRRYVGTGELLRPCQTPLYSTGGYCFTYDLFLEGSTSFDIQVEDVAVEHVAFQVRSWTGSSSLLDETFCDETDPDTKLDGGTTRYEVAILRPSPDDPCPYPRPMPTTGEITPK